MRVRQRLSQPERRLLNAVRDAAELRALGDAAAAHRLLESAWESNRASAALAAELIRSHAAHGDRDQAEKVLAGSQELVTAATLRELTDLVATVRQPEGD